MYTYVYVLYIHKLLLSTIILLPVSLLFESLLKMKLAPSNITWLLCCSMVWSIGSLMAFTQGYRHEAIYNVSGPKKGLNFDN